MISGEDESSSIINGRLRPRKTNPNPPNQSDNKIDQDKNKRNTTPSKASPKKTDDLITKADSSTTAQLLCPYCDRTFSTKLSASKHARRIHLTTTKQDSFIECLFCSHSEAEPNDAIRHMVDSHPNQYFACLDCHTRFLSTSELAEHKLGVCEKQAYRSKLRQKTLSKKDHQKKLIAEDQYPRLDKDHKIEPEYKSLVISCELKPSHALHDDMDIEDKITTNLILPSNKALSSAELEKNAVIILDDVQWNRRIPSNFSFHNADADQILSRLGVVHRSPRVGESTRREWLKMIDDSSHKFEKCFDTNFYTRVASNVQENLARFLDGSFNFSPNPDKVIKTRKSKSSTIINTAEGFPILLPHEQYTRNRFDGYMPREIAPKHKWKWDSAENDKNIVFDANAMKRDNHVNNCIITLMSSLDIWTQLRMRRKFEGIFCKAITEKVEKQNIIGEELKEILESRDIPCTSSQVVESTSKIASFKESSEFPWLLGLSAVEEGRDVAVTPAELSGEWVRPRCYVCCACGDQTRDARALSLHMASHHPNAQVQHYEIVGESLLNADILKHLYVPPSQMSNRTRPPRGFRDCTKCNKSITVKELHQHMLDCAGDTPTVRRKCRSRLFGVRRRRPRLPDITIQKKNRKDLRARHNQNGLLRTRPRIRTEVGDAETIRKMIADLPAKRHRQASGPAAPVLRSRRKLRKTKTKRHTSDDSRNIIPKIDTNIDEDDQPLKPKQVPEKSVISKKRFSSRIFASRNKKKTEKVPSRLHTQDTAKNNETVSKSQQLSCEHPSQRVNISSEGNTPSGEGTNSNGVDGGKSDGSKQIRDDPQKADQKAPAGPSLLKHSINNITAPDCTKSSNLQQQNVLSQQDSFGGNDRDDRHTILVKEVVVPARPDKPPLGTNQKRSSKKLQRSLHLKVQSLNNCIDKIAQKCAISKSLKEDNLPGTTTAERNMFSTINNDISDPHPAIVSSYSDNTGLAINAIPSRTNGEQTLPDNLYIPNGYADPSRIHDASQIIEPSTIVRRNSETYTQRKSNERLLSTTSDSSELVSPRKNGTLATMRCESGYCSQYEKDNPETLVRQPNPWRLNMPYQPDIAYHPGLEFMMKNMPPPEALRFNFPSYTFAPGYSPPDLHNRSRRDNLTRRDEITPHTQMLMCSTQPNQIMPHVPQTWNNQSVYPLPSVLPAMMLSPPNAQIAQRSSTSRKRVSQSSDTNDFRNFDCDNSIANLRRRSAEASHLELYSPYASAFSKAPHEYEKSSDYTSYTQDGFVPHFEVIPIGRNDNHPPSKTVRDNRYQNEGDDYRSATSKKKRNKKSLTPNIDIIPPIVETEVITEPHYMVPATPTQEKAAKSTLSVTSAMSKTLDNSNYHTMQTNSPIVAKEMVMPQKQYETNYTSQGYCGENFQEPFAEGILKECPAEEPLDLSGKNVLVTTNQKMDTVCNKSTQKILEKRNETEIQESLNDTLPIPYITLDLSKRTGVYKSHEYISPTVSLQSGSHGPIPEFSDCYDGSHSANDHQICETAADNWSPKANTPEGDNIEQDLNDKPVEDYKETLAPHKEKLAAECMLANLKSNQSSGGAPSPNSNMTLTSNINTLDQLNQINVRTSSPWGNEGLEVTSNGVDYTSYASSNRMEESYKSPLPINAHKSTCQSQAQGSFSEQNITNPNPNIAKNDMQPSYTTNSQNQILETKHEKALESEIINEANKDSFSVERDPETAKKMAMLPKELIALLGTIPTAKQNELVNVISQMVANPSSMAGNNEVNAPSLNVNVTQPMEETQAIIPISVTSPIESDNRLTVNTAMLPPSSILPKKRHSPSARMNLREQDAIINPNSLISRPSPSSQEPDETSSLVPIHDTDTPIDNGNNQRPTNDEFYKQPSTEDSTTIYTSDDSDSKSFVGNVIDLTEDDLIYSETKPTDTNSKEKVIKHYSEKTANLRAVRIKPPLLRISISDDKPSTLRVVTQHLASDSTLNDPNTLQILQSDCNNGNDGTNFTVNDRWKNLSTIPIIEAPKDISVSKIDSKEVNITLPQAAHQDLFKSQSVLPSSKQLDLDNIGLIDHRSIQYDDEKEDSHNTTNIGVLNSESHLFLGSTNNCSMASNSKLNIEVVSNHIRNHDSCKSKAFIPKSPNTNNDNINKQNSHLKSDLSAPCVDDQLTDIQNEMRILSSPKLVDPIDEINKATEEDTLTSNDKETSVNPYFQKIVGCSNIEEKVHPVISMELSMENPQHEVTVSPLKNIKSSDNDDSDDDVMLAVIVKQRQLDHQSAKKSSSVDNVKNIDEKQSLDVDKSSETELTSTKSGFVNINTSLATIENKVEPFLSDIDATLKSNEKIIAEIQLLQSTNNNEPSHEEVHVDEQKNDLIKNNEPNSNNAIKIKKNKNTKKNDTVRSTGNKVTKGYSVDTNDNTDHEVALKKSKKLLSKERKSRKKQRRKLKKQKQSKISLQILKDDVGMLDNSDLEVHHKTTPDTDSCSNISNDKKVDAHDPKEVSNIPINTQCILEGPLFRDTVEKDTMTRRTRLSNFEALESSYTDSEPPNKLIDTKRALRRSKLKKSINDDCIRIQEDPSSTATVQKTPVTKKQLIFSKLLHDDNFDTEKSITNNSIVVTRDKSASDTEIRNNESTKRKKSRTGTTKNKKNKSLPKDIYSEDIPISSHIRTDLDTSIETIDSNENKATLDDNSGDIIIKSTEKRKLKNTDLNDIFESKVKRSKCINKNETASEKSDSQNDNPSSQDLKIKINKQDSVSAEIKSNRSGSIGAQDSDNKKNQPDREIGSSEIRTACYNRPVIYKQIRSPTVPVKNSDNYDPYDIDFEDMAESTKPVIKRKVGKSVCSNNTSKGTKKATSVVNSAEKNHQPDSTEIVETNRDSTSHSLSDSDSSICDEPLQRYLEEKEKLKAESQLVSTIQKESKQNETLILDCIDKTEIHIQSEMELDETNKMLDNIDKAIKNANAKNTNDEINEDVKTGITPVERESLNTHNSDLNQMEADYVTLQSNKPKRNKKSLASSKSESTNSNEIDPQWSSDKYMENFGFYSIRQPRKSNLIASKKISETFRESDDTYFRTKDRHKKYSHNDNKKTCEGATTKAAQENTKVTSDRKSSIEQPTASNIDVDLTNTATELDDKINDEELDLVTAQKILESEEVKQLENYLFTGLKEAANANAGKTFRLSHLRASDKTFDEIVGPNDSDAIPSAAQSETIESPESCKKTNKTNYKKQPEYKELMYPDEEVNIYEDKYDIIKRRRTQAAAAKQAHSVDEPRTSSKNKKKSDRKNNKKSPKKTTQVSQVPTKGALKGFDGIKVSIPTQDLVLPPIVSPPRQVSIHKLPKSSSKRVDKELNNSEYSSKSENDGLSKVDSTLDKDVYEFQDDEKTVCKDYKIAKSAEKFPSSSSENEDKNEKDNNKTQYDATKTGSNDHYKKKRYKGKGKGKRTRVQDKTKNKESVMPNVKDNANYEKDTPNNDYNENTITDTTRSDLHMKTVGGTSRPTSPYKNVSSNLNNFEDVDNSDIIDRSTCIPGGSGFVPDRNDESSYDSDSSAPHFPGLDYACTCPSDVDSDDSEIERGCANTSCRYIHLNAAKNAVMGKIFKNNALRCDKSHSPQQSPKPKPDLDLLFDSLLEKTTTNNATAVRTPTSPVPGPSWASDYYFANDGREMSNVDDGFSSPNRPGSEKTTEIAFTPTAALDSAGASFAEFDDTTRELSAEERCTLESLQRIQMGHSARPIAPITYTKPTEQSDGTDYADKKRAHHSHSLKKRRADVGYTSHSEETASKSSRKSSKKHKTHKSKKIHVIDKNLGDAKSPERIIPSLNRRNHSTHRNNEPDGNRPEDKESPSRKSDEGISTSHDNSADAYELRRDDDPGVARQRARRKCTVGKQNVLVEHWSSSDSDSIPRATASNTASASRKRKGKKPTAVKKSVQQCKKREEVNSKAEVSEEEGASSRTSTSKQRAVPAPSLRAVAGPSSRRHSPRSPHRSSPGPSLRSSPVQLYRSSPGPSSRRRSPRPQHRASPEPSRRSPPLSLHRTSPGPSSRRHSPRPPHRSSPGPSHRSPPVSLHRSPPGPSHRSSPGPSSRRHSPRPPYWSPPGSSHRSSPGPSHRSSPGPSSRRHSPRPPYRSPPGPSHRSPPRPSHRSSPGPSSRRHSPRPPYRSPPGPLHRSSPGPSYRLSPGPSSRRHSPRPPYRSPPGPSHRSPPGPSHRSSPGPSSRRHSPRPPYRSPPGPSSRRHSPRPPYRSSPGPSRRSPPVSSFRSSPGPSRRSSPGPSRRSSPGPSRRSSPGPSRRSSPGPSRAIPGPSRAGPSYAVPGPSWAMPGPSWAMPGPSWAMPGPSRAVPGPSHAVPGPSRAVPGPSLRVRPATRGDASDAPSDSSIRGVSTHGWIYGRDHKRLVALLVRAKGTAVRENRTHVDYESDEESQGTQTLMEDTDEEPADELEQGESRLVSKLNEPAALAAAARTTRSRPHSDHSRPRTRTKHNREDQEGTSSDDD